MTVLMKQSTISLHKMTRISTPFAITQNKMLRQQKVRQIREQKTKVKKLMRMSNPVIRDLCTGQPQAATVRGVIFN